MHRASHRPNCPPVLERVATGKRKVAKSLNFIDAPSTSTLRHQTVSNGIMATRPPNRRSTVDLYSSYDTYCAKLFVAYCEYGQLLHQHWIFYGLSRTSYKHRQDTQADGEIDGHNYV